MDERKLKVLISEERLQARIQELGKEIQHYGDECITCIGVLKGSFMFMADLVRAIGGDVRCEFPGRFIVSRRNQIYGCCSDYGRSSKSH